MNRTNRLKMDPDTGVFGSGRNPKDDTQELFFVSQNGFKILDGRVVRARISAPLNSENE